jgi:Ni/Co efflux regulator RcnB
MNRRALLVVLAASSTFGGTAFAQSSDVRQNEQNIEAAARQRAAQAREDRRVQRQYDTPRPGDPAYRQRYDRRDDHGRGRVGWRGDDRRYDRNDRRGGDWRHDGRGRGAGPDHAWYRGSRLPPQYRTRQYVVDDWRAHRLSAPPRGYHWVQAGGDYVLVAIATGIIASILLSQ